MLERDIERYLVDRVHELGGEAYKFTSPSHRGVFDRIVVMPRGVVWFVELKTPTGRMSRLQELFQKRLTELGQRNVVLSSKDAVNNFIEILKSEQTS
jgi:hypothetical protein